MMTRMTRNPYHFKYYLEMKEDQPVTAKAIADEFRYDRSTAMERFAEKRLYVTGIVSCAGPDL